MAAAMGEFELALKYDGRSERAYYHRGLAFARTGDKERAMADLRNALSLGQRARQPRGPGRADQIGNRDGPCTARAADGCGAQRRERVSKDGFAVNPAGNSQPARFGIAGAVEDRGRPAAQPYPLPEASIVPGLTCNICACSTRSLKAAGSAPVNQT